MPFDPSQLLDQLQDTADSRESELSSARPRWSPLEQASIKTPEMDNRPADWLIRCRHRLEELSDVLRSFGIDAKMLTVRAFVRFAASDQDAPFSLRFQSVRQRFSDAAAVGKDKPVASAGWRGRLRDSWSSRNVHLTATGIRIATRPHSPRSALVSRQGFEAQSQNFDCHLARSHPGAARLP